MWHQWLLIIHKPVFIYLKKIVSVVDPSILFALFIPDEVIAAIDPKKVEIFQRYVNNRDCTTSSPCN